jgi:outer membrane protein OmpA-like peptidoglycan-associated protein
MSLKAQSTTSATTLAAVLAIAMLGSVACTPQGKIVVDIHADPVQADLRLRERNIGHSPQTINVSSMLDLLQIGAVQETKDPVEKRIRFLGSDRVEVSFLFGDNRSAMAKALGLRRILVFDYSAGFTFDVGRSDIKPEFQALLVQQADLLNTQFAQQDVHICGHTDSTGNSERNKSLSIARAKSVADELISRGVPKSRLKVQGFGESYPITTNDSAEGRAYNRRTEVILAQ